MVDEVILQVRGGLGVLHSLCDSVAMLDMVRRLVLLVRRALSHRMRSCRRLSRT